VGLRHSLDLLIDDGVSACLDGMSANDLDILGTKSSHLFCTSGVKNSDAFSGAYEKSGLNVFICCDTRRTG
jgi:hypothetical protein